MSSITTFPYPHLPNGIANEVFIRLAPVYTRLADPEQPDGKAKEAVYLIAAPKIRAFADLSAELSDVMRQSVKFASTQDLDTLDTERDAATALVNAAIDRGLRSTRDNVHAAALRIDAKRDAYPRLARRQRDEQTNLTRELLADLAPLADDIALIPGLSALLDSLSEINAQFSDNFNARIGERSDVITGRTAEVRARANVAATDVAACVNMIASVHTAPFLEAAIKDINGIHDQARLDLSARRRGRAQRGATGNTPPPAPETSTDTAATNN